METQEKNTEIQKRKKKMNNNLQIGSLIYYIGCSIIVPKVGSYGIIKTMKDQRIIQFKKVGIGSRPSSYDTGLAIDGILKDKVESRIILSRLKFDYSPVSVGEAISCAELMKRAGAAKAIGSLLFGKMALDFQETKYNFLPVPPDQAHSMQIALPRTKLGRLKVSGYDRSEYIQGESMPYLDWSQTEKKWDLKFADFKTHKFDKNTHLVLMK